jgi:hypothetical protein
VSDDCYFFEINNSIYKLKSYLSIIVSVKPIHNIIVGCPPEIAIKTENAKVMLELMKQHRKERD